MTSSISAARASCGTALAWSGSPCAISTSGRDRIRIEIDFAADFADVFEVRGSAPRAARRRCRARGRRRSRQANL